MGAMIMGSTVMTICMSMTTTIMLTTRFRQSLTMRTL